MTNCAHNRDFLQLTRTPRTEKFRAYISAKVHKFLNFSTNYLLESLLVLVGSRRSDSGVGAKSENEGKKYGGREGEGERKERRSPSLSLPSPTPSMFFLLISFLRRPQSVMCFFFFIPNILKLRRHLSTVSYMYGTFPWQLCSFTCEIINQYR